MSQAVATLTRWAFGALGLARIEWRAAVGNVASLRVAEKNGYTLEGTLRQALVVGDGRRVDCWVGSAAPGRPAPARGPAAMTQVISSSFSRTA